MMVRVLAAVTSGGGDDVAGNVLVASAAFAASRRAGARWLARQAPPLPPLCLSLRPTLRGRHGIAPLHPRSAPHVLSLHAAHNQNTEIDTRCLRV